MAKAEVKEKNSQGADIVEIAKRKREISLIEKMNAGKSLSPNEIRELEFFKIQREGGSGELIVRTQKEVAKHFNIAERIVRRWVKGGMPITSAGFYPIKKIEEWRRGASPEVSDRKTDIELEILELKRKQLQDEYDASHGLLVPLEDVRKSYIATITVFKTNFLSLPKQMAPVLALKEPRDIQVLLKDKIEEIFRELKRGLGVEDN